MVMLMNNGIRIAYPRTKYLKLNLACTEIVRQYINEFMVYAKDPVQENFTYTLDISHDEYSYKDYLSIVFYISMYTGGAHPNNQIVTVSYDKQSDKIITINDLMKENSNLLSVLSEESRKILDTNPNIVDHSMLLEGTKPIAENFKLFAFTPTGLMIFFPQYQVAPYSSGSFKVVISYPALGRRNLSY